MNKLTKKLWTLIDEVAFSMGYEIVELEYTPGRKNILRIFIDSLDSGKTISIDDCAKLSRELDIVLDIEDIIQSAYFLEVSSPGLERPIRLPKDFKRFIGKNIKVKCIKEVYKKKVFKGILKDFKEDKNIGDAIVLDTGKSLFDIKLDNIKKANIIVDYNELL